MQLNKSRNKINLLIFLALLSFAFFLLHIFNLENLSKNQNNLLKQSYNKLAFLQNIYIDVKNIESGQRGYLISGDSLFLNSYYKGFSDLQQDKELCINSFNEDELIQTQYDSILYFIDQKILFSKEAVEIKNNFGSDSAQGFIATGRGIFLMSQIDNKVNDAQNYFLYSIDQLTTKNLEHFFDRRNNLIIIVIIFSFIFIIFYFLLNKYYLIQVRKEKDLKYNQAVFNNIYDAIITTDLNYNIVKWNDYAQKIFLYKEEEVIGKSLFAVLKIKDEDNQLERIVEEFKKNNKWIGELINHDKNDKQLHVEVSASILSDENQRPIGTVSVIRDVTENRKIKNNLQQRSHQLEFDLQEKFNELTHTNERLSYILNATNDAIWDWEIGTEMIWGNRQYLQLLDLSVGEFVSYSSFISKIHQDDRAELSSSFDKIIQEKKSSSISEFRFLMPNGDLKYFLNKSIYIFNSEGNPVRVLGALQDITIQKQIQAQIINEKEISDGIINSLPGLFYLFNKEGKYLRWNENTKIVSGYTDEDMINQNPLDFFPQDQRALLEDKINRVFTFGSDNVEADLLTKNNERVPYYFTGTFIKYNGQDCMMGVGIDISEKVNTQNQLRELAVHIQNIREEERKSISREIHDELGQQLTGLNMEVSWVKKNINNPSAASEKIDHIIVGIKNSIKTLQTISTKLRPSVLDDLGLIAALEWQCEEFQKRYLIQNNFVTNIRIIDIPAEISTAIFRIYQESLTNILKHAKANRVESSLFLESERLILSIADDGIGFEEKEIVEKKSFGLLGIKERTLLLNGTFEVSAANGKGTNIVVKIPVSV